MLIKQLRISCEHPVERSDDAPLAHVDFSPSDLFAEAQSASAPGRAARDRMTRRSAIEEALAQSLRGLSFTIEDHDRGVVAGLLLSCVPILPLPVLGLAITLVNRALLRRGRLDLSERALLHRALWMGGINTVLGFVLAFAIGRIVFGLEWSRYVGWVASLLQSFWDLLRGMRSEPTGTFRV